MLLIDNTLARQGSVNVCFLLTLSLSQRNLDRRASPNIIKWNNMTQIKELCKQNGVEYRELNRRHLRLIGGITCDYWPTTGRAWIVGTDKSFKPNNEREIMDILNLKIFPSGVQWIKKVKRIKLLIKQEYINIDHLCPICAKSYKPDKFDLEIRNHV